MKNTTSKKKVETMTDAEMVTGDRNNSYTINDICTESFILGGSVPHGRLACTAMNTNLRAIRLKLKYQLDVKKA